MQWIEQIKYFFLYTIIFIYTDKNVWYLQFAIIIDIKPMIPPILWVGIRFTRIE
jgi:hypothetical protein